MSATWLIFWVYWFIAAFNSKRNISYNLGGSGSRLVIVLVAFVVLRFWRFSYGPPIPSLLFSGLGLVLLFLGLGLCIWSRLAMGKNWGMPMSQKAEPELVSSGPYQSIRHPIYSGILLATIGSIFIAGLTWIVLLVVVGGYFIYSAYKEEENLSRSLPGYKDYRRHTKMFIPFVF
jgi:protein-S-isoprenylcysteine O-methyltransferase Ste14